ncbi:MAG TPA: hypothetical protein VGN07_13935 [Steroidobacteraceae bacterium]|jgi:hypothetical protein
MFATQDFLHTSQRAACLLMSMLIVSSVLALGAFGIESMMQNAATAQHTALTVQA